MNEFMYIKFNERIKVCMKQMDIKQIKLAEMLGYEQSYISKICNTKSNKDIPNIELLDKIASLLNTTVPYLLGYIDNTNIDNAYITNEVGLGDKAIDNLKKLFSKDSVPLLSDYPEIVEEEISINKQIINDLIGSDSFIELFELIKRIALLNKTDNTIVNEFNKLPSAKKKVLDYAYLPDEALNDNEKHTLHHLTTYERYIIKNYDHIISMEHEEKAEYRKYFTIKAIQELLEEIYK